MVAFEDGDYATARDEWRRAAEAGDSRADYRLGLLAELGIGMAQNYTAAAERYRRAAGTGYAPAQYRLGVLQQLGLGVKENTPGAYRWLTLAGQSDGAIARAAKAFLDSFSETLSAEQRAVGDGEVAAWLARRAPQPAAPQPAAPQPAAPPSGGQDAAPGELVSAPLPATECGPPAAGSLLCTAVARLAPYLAGGSGLSAGVTGGSTLVEGDALVIEVVAPAFASNIYIDYFQLDGNVVHLFPNVEDVDNRSLPGQRFTLGERAAGGPVWRVSPPFGRELITVIATSHELFTSLRSDAEASADYLTALEKRLAVLQAGTPGFEATAVYLLLITTPQG